MGQFDTQIMKLDDAYETINKLSLEIDKGQKKVLEDLENIINNIKTHWRGTDASNHINSLIDEYDKYSDFFNELGDMTSYISSYFVLMQRTRARMSEVTKVGTPELTTVNSKQLAKVENTEEYYYDPALRNDYNDICDLNSYYKEFINKTDQEIVTLLDNWKAGKGRNEIKEYFNAFWIVSNRISSRIEDLKDQMGKAIANASKIE